MKIALITEEGKIISQHFGRAHYYLVVTIEEKKVVSRVMREKLGHQHFHGQESIDQTHGIGHGQDEASHMRHMNMAETINDCAVLICGGMGHGAYESFKRSNKEVLITNLKNVDEVIQAFINGTLINHLELLH